MSNRHIIVGAGPAAICEIATLLKNGVAGANIMWVDSLFKVGAFGTVLSQGSSVPGNTTVESYQIVNEAIYKTVPISRPTPFELDTLPLNFVCTLKIAAEPLQHITNELRKIVSCIEGMVTDIFITPEGFHLQIKLHDATIISQLADKVILAIGAKPRIFSPPAECSNMQFIDPNSVFIETNLQAFLLENPNIKTVAVIGSSHSAALAVMHLLKAGIYVKQFMNKEYKYAMPMMTAEGKAYTKYDNTGLKGNVAEFTRKLLANDNSLQANYQKQLKRYIGKTYEEVNGLLVKHTFDCTHAVACIGYETAATLKVNHLPLASLSHNNQTMVFNEIKNLRGIGIAFPQQIKALSGETEFAVGVGKFWLTSNSTN